MQQDDGAAGERAVIAQVTGGGVGGRSLGDVRVLIVDDHDVIRAGLVSLLHGRAGISVVGQASRARDGARLAGVLLPDVVLIEVGLPDLRGPRAIRAILVRHPDARIIALSLAATEAEVLAALAAGACGHLLNDVPVAEMGAAARGVPWLSPRAAQAILSGGHEPVPLAARSCSAAARLSLREREVLRLIAGGMSTVELAQALRLDLRAAHEHLARILAISVPNPRRPVTPATSLWRPAKRVACGRDSSTTWPGRG